MGMCCNSTTSASECHRDPDLDLLFVRIISNLASSTNPNINYSLVENKAIEQLGFFAKQGTT